MIIERTLVCAGLGVRRRTGAYRLYHAARASPRETALQPVLSSFKAPIDWAAAYGSGVLPQAQAQAEASAKRPMTDLLLSTPNVESFHRTNMAQNPGHYPLYARAMGARLVGHVGERWGAGVWYVTNVDMGGINVKYGVISTSSLAQDLSQWTTFYLSGRLQKPVLTLVPAPPSLAAALAANTRGALALSLILLPKEFTEDELWEQVAGLSYSGDPRMSVPGAENPEKVKNIVRGDGARAGFREIYGGLVQGMGVAGGGGGEQPTTLSHLSALASLIPPNLVLALSTHYPSLPPRPSSSDWTQPLSDPNFRKVVSSELCKIIHGPALRQSVKGLFTAGPVKSFWYAWAKFGKWMNGKKPRGEV